MTQAFLLFHLNLAYSSIAADQRGEVIQRCYHPLLDLAEEKKVKLGIELTGWTLERIAECDAGWIERFRTLVAAGQCELIGSGYTQMIGPLVPYEVNTWNHTIGLDLYKTLLGVKPKLALVNEMAYSSGLVRVYQQAGYEGIVMDRDNISLALGMSGDDNQMPCYAKGLEEESLPVLWSDSIMFQKLQRYAHGDIRLQDYQSYFLQRSKNHQGPISIYSNDAEVFDYRPGRFSEEAEIHHTGEWQRVGKIVDLLNTEGVNWLSPSEALALQCEQGANGAVKLSSIREPIPVKKQAKYNISRWAISGRDDLRFNTLCHRLYKAIGGSDQPISQRELCELWASDLRTHIRPERWQEAESKLAQLATKLNVPTAFGGGLNDVGNEVIDIGELNTAGFQISYDSENILLSISTDEIKLVLNLRRGLTIDSLAFASQDFEAVVGTLPHGYFHSIELGADFYSNGVVVELITEHRRITDLDWVAPRFFLNNGCLHIRAEIKTHKGIIEKEVVIPAAGEDVQFATAFPDWDRPYGTVRAGTITLLPETFGEQLVLETNTGGRGNEVYQINQPCEHMRPGSTLVSCTTGLGGANGEIIIGGKRRVAVRWDPSESAVFPMLYHRISHPTSLTRIMFSLSEVDETFRQGGVLPVFRYRLSPLS